MRRKHHRNDGLRKICACPRRQWAKCPHSWHFNYRPRHGTSYRFSLDATLGRRVRSKTEAEEEAARIKAGILAGTFRRPGEIPAPAQKPAALSFGAFGATYVERASAVSGKKTWKNDRGMMNRLVAFVLSWGQAALRRETASRGH